MKAFLLFPHQLFEEVWEQPKDQLFFLIESDLYFKQYNFHQQKLLFHRASLRYFADSLREKGFQVKYVEANDSNSDISKLITYLQSEGFHTFTYYDTHDYLLERRIARSC